MIVYSAEAQYPLMMHLCQEINLAPTANMRCIGNVQDNELLGVVGFDNYNGKSVIVHATGKGNWLNRQLIRATFQYAFVTMSCEAILAMIDSANTKSITFTIGMGFQEIARIVKGHPDGDLIIYELRKENCRWLKMRPDTSNMH